MKELIVKATSGDLDPKDLDEVVCSLEDSLCDPYDALLIIGRSGEIKHRRLVEKYLHAPDNPMLARLSLMILCRYWKLTTDYWDVLEAFVQKVEWDECDDVRLLAISVVGSSIALKPDSKMLRLLIEIFRAPSERQLVRETAYCALAEASGKTPTELPSAAHHFDLEHGLDPEVVAYIQAAEHAFTVGP